MNDKQSRVVIIGGGPAAIEAAKTAQIYSDHITVISNKQSGDWSKLGWSAGIIELSNAQLSWKDILNQTRQKLEDWSKTIHTYLTEKKIKTVIGNVIRVNSKYVVVDHDGEESYIHYDKLFIAVGSSPYFPKGFEPDGKYIFTPKSINLLEELPSTILLIGNGPISYEYASIFNYFGVRIKWLVPEEGAYTPFDRFIHTYLNKLYIERDIELIRGPFVKKIEVKDNKVTAIRENGETFTAEKAFYSVGFVSNIHTIQFEDLTFQMQDGTISVNEYGQTSYKNIYVIGDARHANSSSLSMQQGRLSMIHAFEPSELGEGYNHPPVVFNFNPQVGVVGNADVGVKYFIATIGTSRFKTSYTKANEGIMKISYTNNGEIKAAIVIDEYASEIINLIALAIQYKINISNLANFYTTHPSYSDVVLSIIREIEHLLRSNTEMSV